MKRASRPAIALVALTLASPALAQTNLRTTAPVTATKQATSGASTQALTASGDEGDLYLTFRVSPNPSTCALLTSFTYGNEPPAKATVRWYTFSSLPESDLYNHNGGWIEVTHAAVTRVIYQKPCVNSVCTPQFPTGANGQAQSPWLYTSASPVASAWSTRESSNVACAGPGGSWTLQVHWRLVDVSVSPPSAQVLPLGHLQLTAAVTGTGTTAVTWRVAEGAAGGTVTSGGYYTAPVTPGTYHVIATSTFDTSRSATATIVVQPVQVAISPASTTVIGGQTAQFTATVTGASSTGVTWSVAEGAAGGTVTATGLYTAPIASGTYHVVATSVQDPTKSAIATVTILPVSIAISPASTTILRDHTAQLTATVTNATDTRVTWNVSEGAAGGSVDSTGLYTAPSVGGTYHVVATSIQDPSKSATTTIEVRTYFEVSFVGSGGFSADGQPTIPSGVLPNDLLIVRALTSAAPAGWAAFGPVFWKRFAAGDATPTFGAGVHAQMAAFRGVAPAGSPFEVLGQAFAKSKFVLEGEPFPISSPWPITTLTDGSIVLLSATMSGTADDGYGGWWLQFGNPISGPARSPAIIWDDNPTPGWTNEAVGLWFGLQVPAGSTGTGAVPQVSIDFEGYLGYEAVLLAVRPPPAYPPASPTSLSGPATDSDGSYALSWVAGSGYVDHYELYENGVLVQSVTAPTATITGRAFGTYDYQVQACNEVGCSAPSTEFVVTVAP